MDVFIEQIVAKRKSTKDFILSGLIILAALVVAAVLIYLSMLFPLVTMVGIFAAIGVLFGGWWLIRNFDVEYEYIITNGELDIDQITARRKRKRLITVKCADFETAGKYEKQRHEKISYQTRLFAGTGENEANSLFVTFRHPQAGHTLVVFNPNAKVLKSMKPFLSHTVAHDLYQAAGVNISE